MFFHVMNVVPVLLLTWDHVVAVLVLGLLLHRPWSLVQVCSRGSLSVVWFVQTVPSSCRPWWIHPPSVCWDDSLVGVVSIYESFWVLLFFSEIRSLKAYSFCFSNFLSWSVVVYRSLVTAINFAEILSISYSWVSFNLVIVDWCSFLVVSVSFWIWSIFS